MVGQIRRRPLRLSLLLVGASLLAGCPPQTRLTTTDDEAPEESAMAAPAEDAAGSRSNASRRPPAGSSCTGRSDCSSGQICVGARCRYPETSVAGEILAAAAAAQAAGGDHVGAMATYDESFRAFARQRAPVPPEIACSSAALILRRATDAEARERGAQRADLCFRTSVPGLPERAEVRIALARLRFEGLSLELFDRDDPQERFFTGEQSRPTADAVSLELQMPDLEPRELASHTGLRELLSGEDGSQVITGCFLTVWEERHQRHAEASLVLRMSSTLRDMGSFDLYEPAVAVEASRRDNPFEDCLLERLAALFDLDARSRRPEPWEQPIRIVARVQ